MTKTYDRMKWDFIEATLEAFGFHRRFIRIIKECISLESYSILLNGSPSGKLIPSRGLRQGDPFSPYLFILWVEVLPKLLIKADSESTIYGVKVSKNAPCI